MSASNPLSAIIFSFASAMVRSSSTRSDKKSSLPPSSTASSSLRAVSPCGWPTGKRDQASNQSRKVLQALSSTMSA
ncbi:MAG: hypothetical protein U0165_07685 [Polyangiaceae bacterium]